MGFTKVIEGGYCGATATRAELLSRGTRGGLAVLAGGSALALLATDADADTLPSTDLAYARLLVGAELLAINFYTQAVAAQQFANSMRKHLQQALFNEQEHYRSVAGILSGAGQVPAVAGDINFSYPSGSFGSRSSIAMLGFELETTFVGAYVGAVGAMQTSSLLSGIASIGANEAQHLSLFSDQLYGRPIGVSFPPALTIDQASAALDAFTA